MRCLPCIECSRYDIPPFLGEWRFYKADYIGSNMKYTENKDSRNDINHRLDSYPTQHYRIDVA